MGHESSKTTELYTHITTKGFDQIQNPLDKLDFLIYYPTFVRQNGYVLFNQTVSVFSKPKF